jgi:hypothetical protein
LQVLSTRRFGEPASSLCPDVESFVTLDVLDAAYQGKTSLLG